MTNTTLAPTKPAGGCDHSDEAWMLMATVLVLGMFPGVGFFEAGLLRHKVTTSILAQVFCGLAMLSVMWVVFGYSLTFSPTATSGVIGNLHNALFLNIGYDDCAETGRPISTGLYAVFQLMFACITPLLMTGAYAERFAWGPFVAFTIAWEILVYYPVAHWIWNPHGWLAKMGAIDFAGGIVIHTTAGVSSLVVVAVLGRRHGFDQRHGVFPYSSLTTAATGCALLWTGWFGFNGGSALASNGAAAIAVANSQIGAVFAACSYMLVIMWMTKTPSTIAIMNGAIAGLAGVTPASGYITNQSAMVLGVILGLCVEPCVHLFRHKLRLDDALDVSVVHGVTGIVGSLFIGFAGSRHILPTMKYEGIIYGGEGHLLGVQLLAVLVSGVWAALMSGGILFAISRVTPLRIPESHEREGMDLSVFKEASQNFDPDASPPDMSLFELDANAGNANLDGSASEQPMLGQGGNGPSLFEVHAPPEYTPPAQPAAAAGAGSAGHLGASGAAGNLGVSHAVRHAAAAAMMRSMGMSLGSVGSMERRLGASLRLHDSTTSLIALEQHPDITIHGTADPLRPEEPTAMEQMEHLMAGLMAPAGGGLGASTARRPPSRQVPARSNNPSRTARTATPQAERTATPPPRTSTPPPASSEPDLLLDGTTSARYGAA